jgi:hypothetical protein
MPYFRFSLNTVYRIKMDNPQNLDSSKIWPERWGQKPLNDNTTVRSGGKGGPAQSKFPTISENKIELEMPEHASNEPRGDANSSRNIEVSFSFALC